MRRWLVLAVFAAAGWSGCFGETIASGDPTVLAQTGRSRFATADFRLAARDFTKALRQRPHDADLHFWLGKSYARLAETDGAVYAPRHARKARVSFERAVELAPRNHDYLSGLFDFYMASPEWFSGGLDRAALLIERIEPEDPGAQKLLRWRLAEARGAYSGTDWRLRQSTLVPAGAFGRIIP